MITKNGLFKPTLPKFELKRKDLYTYYITLKQQKGFNKKLCELMISWHSFLRNLDEKFNEYNSSIYEKTL